MAEFRMKIAGAVASVQSMFDSTPQFFHNYLTQEPADFSVDIHVADLRFEQWELDAEAEREGFRRREFTAQFLERTAIQRAFAEDLLCCATVLLHGSAVAVDGEGYLFMARSGTGKSTHTRFWRELFGDRAMMINDDKPFLRIGAEGVTAFGSPWSGKHGLDTNMSVPLKGICILERGTENVIRPITPEEALPMLRHQTYQPLTSEKQAATEKLVLQLAERVPLWRMTCTRNPKAAQVAYDAMSMK